MNKKKVRKVHLILRIGSWSIGRTACGHTETHVWYSTQDAKKVTCLTCKKAAKDVNAATERLRTRHFRIAKRAVINDLRRSFRYQFKYLSKKEIIKVWDSVVVEKIMDE